MYEIHYFLCGPVQNRKVPKGVPKHKLDARGEDVNNIHIESKKFDDYLGNLLFESRIVDLIEIASFVYTADQMVNRGADTRADFGRGWRRELHFRIAVSDFDFWSHPGIIQLLCDLMGFLSDDSYFFEFEPRPPRNAKLQGCVPFARHDPNPPDEVMLFSGGLDSLAGAVELGFGQKKKALWVKHFSNPKTYPLIQQLAYELSLRLDNRGELITVTVNKNQDYNEERIQRTRSFLFASLAFAFAHALRKQRILFFENGIVSVNLPVATQVVGARATRTTHPRVLRLMSHLFTQLSEKVFTVENPFLWKTKADIVQILQTHGCERLIAQSQSCAKTIKASTDQPHCGVCSQCVDRQVALLRSNLTRFDLKDGYRIPLLSHSVERKEIDLNFVIAYFATARRIHLMKGMHRFFASYGEATRVWAHPNEIRVTLPKPHLRPIPPEDPTQIAQQLFDLHKRHAEGVTGVAESIIKDHARSAFLDEPSNPVLLATLLTKTDRQPVQPLTATGSTGASIPTVIEAATSSNGDTSQVAKSVAAECNSSVNIFQLRGDSFWIRFQGSSPITLSADLGGFYIRQVLMNPFRKVSVVSIIATTTVRGELPTQSHSTVESDSETLALLDEHVRELDEEIEAIRQGGSIQNLEDLTREREMVVAYINTTFSRDRDQVQERTDIKRRVDSARKAYTRFRASLSTSLPSLAQHLKECLKTGRHWFYSPESTLQRWEF